MRRIIRWTEYSELTALFFIQSMAVAIWMVPLSMVSPCLRSASALAMVLSPGAPVMDDAILSRSAKR